MKLVGVDFGLVRTGLAATDPGAVLAYPLAVLSLDDFPDRKTMLAALAARILEERPDLVVVGLPLLADGGESLTTRQARNFAARLRRRLPCPCVMVDELLTSEEAARTLREGGMARRKAKALLDAQAAARILEAYLADPSRAVPVPDGRPGHDSPEA